VYFRQIYFLDDRSRIYRGDSPIFSISSSDCSSLPKHALPARIPPVCPLWILRVSSSVFKPVKTHRRSDTHQRRHGSKSVCPSLPFPRAHLLTLRHILSPTANLAASQGSSAILKSVAKKVITMEGARKERVRVLGDLGSLLYAQDLFAEVSSPIETNGS
jgi:hypothetical protein